MSEPGFAVPSTSSVAALKTSTPPDIADKGDCVKEGASRLIEVPCGSPTATHIVLERLPGADADCRPVPGVYDTYLSYTGSSTSKVCLGVAGRDPANGINMARPGDCVRVGEGIKGERVPCTSPGALRVLARFDTAPLTQQTCAGTPGTTKISGWRLKLLGANANPPGQGIYDAVYCLTPP
ncbi:LppU/SCO3897 family protein [Nocardia wallacei]|uniref:LppU/SCO3897 family protein n=1 Tax=Nocardia wallacei TaxID=480035 RepID=UPI0024574239|nr:hypothetical protein [Nocardia wallacei]